MNKINLTTHSSAREAIERVLKEAAGPLSGPEISRLSGISISLTRTHLAHGMNKGRITNLNPNRRGHALYVWGMQDAAPPVVRFRPTGLYTGERSIPVRAGSNEFLKCPSRRGDELVPHALPISMAGGAV